MTDQLIQRCLGALTIASGIGFLLTVAAPFVHGGDWILTIWR
jgi:hypothetical protein